ncbi:MAG: DUF2520 domain-containing protein [Candidatus Nanopelagicales bacterium]|jgi:predicted short-subunit dehydrogenase-like oxidoreductase (DUF2520 family)|nr:DUF2520 domain-containing protein [Actinomycetes bacterium]MCH9831198.1 DUF2520 domain-containing protein [Actinomycetes bacterium]
MDSPPRLRIGVIGAGRVGAVLGAALRAAGHNCVGVSAVSDLSRLRAEALLPNVEIKSADQVVAESELVVLAVPDSVLPELIRGFSVSGVFVPGQFVAHTSGNYGIGVFESAPEVSPMAIHPAMTFTGTSVDLARIVDAPFGVTTTHTLRPVAEALVVEMGGEPIWVPEEARAIYHTAMVLSSNYLNVLVNEAVSLLAESGMENPQRLLAPLLSASLDNALRLGDKGLTGPIARGDTEVIHKHLEALADRPSSQNAYRALAKLATDRALGAGLLSIDQATELFVELSERP